MCYWMMEKHAGAAKASTAGKTTASGRTEKVTPTDDAVTARRQPEEKACADFKGRLQGTAVKEHEEESIS
jgi:hypothetical protein